MKYQVSSFAADCSYWNPLLLSKVNPGIAAIVANLLVGLAAFTLEEIEILAAITAQQAIRIRRRFFIVFEGSNGERFPTTY